MVVLGGLSANGVLADNASTSVLAAKAGADWANNNGGIDGKDVDLTVIDDEGDPTVAITKLREQINKAKPDMVLNSGPSTIADATLPILNQNDILSFNIGPSENSANAAKFPLNFDLASGPKAQVNAYIPVMKEKGYKTIGVLHGSSPTGVDFGKAAADVFAADFDVVADEGYDTSALDMTPQLQAIRSKNPDVLVLDAYGAPLGYILKGIQKLGWDVPIMGNLSVSATGLISTPPPSGVLGTDVVKNLTMEVFNSTVYDPDNKALSEAVSAMKAKGDIKSTLILAYNYDVFPLVAAAADEADSTDSKAIAKALVSDDVQDSAKTVILKRYHFTAEDHSANTGPEDFQFIEPTELKDGQFR
ncbi:hypothetical protein GCM10023353_02440 [Tomitella cavernea]|uniref:Leucine-binding protein domain-containing protein n=1 Tax=Tomitella cavernea TaxID=1387982 RepID=A0ABP9C1J2_9ACTN